MGELGLGGFLVLTKLNRQYLSGFTGSQGILLVRGDRGDKGNWGELYVDDRYLIRARRESGVKVRPIKELTPALSLQKRGLGGVLGVEDRITLKEFAVLKKMFHPLRSRRGKGEVRFVVTSN